MVAAELQARGKDAQVRHLNVSSNLTIRLTPSSLLQEQLKTLRTDLDNAHADTRTLREREESWEATRFQLEAKLREHDNEVQRLRMQIANFESERQVGVEVLQKILAMSRIWTNG